jgi:hypothetical protein
VERTFPAPWRFVEVENGYCILDAAGQALAYVFAEEPDEHGKVTGLTWEDAWRVANVIATVPEVLRLAGRQGPRPTDESSDAE